MGLVSWRALLCTARVLVAGAVAAVGLSACDGPAHPPPPLELTVTSTDATAATRGEDAHFQITVTNPTSHEVKQVTFLEYADLNNTRFQSATCSAQGGATCPDLTPGLWTTPSMPAGSSLTFDVSVAVFFGSAPTFENRFTVQAVHRMTTAEGVGHGTVVADARSGDYRMYWRTGRLTDATFDFMAGSFNPGNGNSFVFTTASDGLLQLPGNARFYGQSDLVVGSVDNGDGPEPFVAARRFVETVAELEGASFNVFGSVLVFGNPLSEFYSAWVEGGMLKTCSSMEYSAQTCPAASLHQYFLTVNDTEFSAAETLGAPAMHFRVAKSGASLIYLRVGEGDQINGLQVGIAVNDGPADSNAFGVSTRGDWGWLSLTRHDYLADWTPLSGGTFRETASLVPLRAVNTGLRTGQRSSDGAVIYLSVNGPLGVAIGAADGAANGEMQLLLTLQ